VCTKGYNIGIADPRGTREVSVKRDWGAMKAPTGMVNQGRFRNVTTVWRCSTWYSTCGLQRFTTQSTTMSRRTHPERQRHGGRQRDEKRQGGLVKMPMCVVPNHPLEQFLRELMQFYPNTRLLVAG
jgi:hypothetical protein